ncbi:hypothetical protein ACHAPJ_002996 [Fusarium lateritium]
MAKKPKNMVPPPGKIPDWREHDGLRREDVLENQGVEFYDPPRQDADSQSYKPSTFDPIFVSINFEYLCMALTGTYPVGHPKKGLKYRYKPITEIGWAVIDTRKITQLRFPPGDRAKDLHKEMGTNHYIVNEFRGHSSSNCNYSWHTPGPYNFAFGRSRYIDSKDIVMYLTNALEELRMRNRTEDEKGKGTLHKLCFITWDSHPDERTLARLGLDWFSEPDIKLLDLQQHYLVSATFRQRPMTSELMDRLGLRSKDQKPQLRGDIENGGYSLTNCAGNNAVFQLQIILTLKYLKPAHVDKLFEGSLVEGENALDWLPFSWTGQHIDRINVPVGEVPTPRKPHELNKSSVPQISTSSLIYTQTSVQPSDLLTDQETTSNIVDGEDEDLLVFDEGVKPSDDSVLIDFLEN